MFAAQLILQTGTVDVLVVVATGVGCNRRRQKRGFPDSSGAETCAETKAIQQ